MQAVGNASAGREISGEFRILFSPLQSMEAGLDIAIFVNQTSC